MGNSGARITERFRLDGLRIVTLENELLYLTIVADRGSDITELVHKPTDTDLLWRRPPGPRPRLHFVPPVPTASMFRDYYVGGWQELFPHAGRGSVYEGAELGFHGEVWGLPWDYEIVGDAPDEVAVRLWVRTVHLPLHLEKTIALRSGEGTVRIHEAVVNETKRPLEFMWGHHPAFGPPLVDRQAIVEAPARTVLVGDARHDWPIDSAGRDHRRLVPDESSTEVMKYLDDFREGWVALTNPKLELGVGLVFDPEVFRYVWLWQELGYTQEAPWFGRAYVLGVEPQSSLPGARDNGGRLLRLEAGGKLETDLLAVIYRGSGVRRITREGKVVPS
jgi:galactose mutarotase-like enzyme